MHRLCVLVLLLLQELRLARDNVAACTQALRAAERQLGELELAAPKVGMGMGILVETR